jgi:hypothetical protein
MSFYASALPVGYEGLQVFALAGGAVDVANVAVARDATALMNPARCGGASGQAAIGPEIPLASTDLPAGKQRQQVADAGEIEALFAHEAEHGGDPGIIERGEVSCALLRFQGNQQPLAFVEAKQVDGDAEVPGHLADLDPLERFVLGLREILDCGSGVRYAGISHATSSG